MRKISASNKASANTQDSSVQWESFNVSETEIDEAVNNDDFLMDDDVNADGDTTSFEPNEDDWALAGPVIDEPSPASQKYVWKQSKRSARQGSPNEYSGDAKPHARVISPDRRAQHSVCAVKHPDLIVELQLQYQQALMRFTKSMRRSDQTRSIVKRQRCYKVPATIQHSGYDDEKADGGGKADLNLDDLTGDFFGSARCRELEETRQRIYQLLEPSSVHNFHSGNPH